EAAIHHFLHAPLEQAPICEDGTTTVSIEGARGVAHYTMGGVLTVDCLTQRRGSDGGGGGEEQSKRDEELLPDPSLVVSPSEQSRRTHAWTGWSSALSGKTCAGRRARPKS